ncbi:MAG: hypothetical protein JWO73_898 [Candidatus Taylorbacteria bacterium]|nr:hypothetical protein [Candidatus Taylorbacteria bacterium]
MTNETFLDTLGLKPVPKRVLMSIVSHGVSTVADLASRLNIPKSSVYDALDMLVGESLVNEYGDERGKTFGISDKEQLARVHKKKMDELQGAHSALLSFIQNHGADDSVAKPKMKFYAGTLGMKQAFRDMPWSKKYTETYLMWPMKDMLDSLGEEFLHWHGKQRFQYDVIINCIEKHSDRSLQHGKGDKYAWLENNLKKNLARIRFMPKGTDWKMSYWIYGDKCLFASGGSEKFAFIIHSKEFSDMMKLMWQSVWEKARD